MDTDTTYLTIDPDSGYYLRFPNTAYGISGQGILDALAQKFSEPQPEPKSPADKAIDTLTAIIDDPAALQGDKIEAARLILQDAQSQNFKRSPLSWGVQSV